MQARSIRGLLVLVSLFTVVAIAGGAAPALANLTPVNTVVSANSTNPVLQGSDGLAIRCPTAELTARTSADGRSFSARLTFSGAGRSQCVSPSAVGLTPVTISCGTFTFRVISSVAVTAASGTINLDVGSMCSFSLRPLGVPCTLNILGPQGPLTGWTYTQATQQLALDLRGLRQPRGSCSIATMTIVATFRLTVG